MRRGLGCACTCPKKRGGISGYAVINSMGLGQDDGTDGTGDGTVDQPIAVSSGILPITTTAPIALNCPGDPGCPTAGTTVTVTPGTTSGSTGNTQLDTALANIAAAWTKIAGQTIAPQTTITTPSGLQVSTPAGQTSALASIFGGSSLLSSSAASDLSALLPWIVGGVALLLVVKAVGK